MRVRVRLQGPLQKYVNSPDFIEWESAAETCPVKELLAQLGVPASAVSIVSVDGSKQGLDYTLKGGENIVVYPQVAGG